MLSEKARVFPLVCLLRERERERESERERERERRVPTTSYKHSSLFCSTVSDNYKYTAKIFYKTVCMSSFLLWQNKLECFLISLMGVRKGNLLAGTNTPAYFATLYMTSMN